MGLKLCCMSVGEHSTPLKVKGDQPLHHQSVHADTHRSKTSQEAGLAKQAPSQVIQQLAQLAQLAQLEPLAKTTCGFNAQDVGQVMQVVTPDIDSQNVKEESKIRRKPISPRHDAFSPIETFVPNVFIQARREEIPFRRDSFSFSGAEFGEVAQGYKNKSKVSEYEVSSSVDNRPLSLAHIPLTNPVKRGRKWQEGSKGWRGSFPSHRSSCSLKTQHIGFISFGVLPKSQPPAPESRSLEWLRISRSRDLQSGILGSMSVDLSPKLPIQSQAWKELWVSSQNLHIGDDLGSALYLGRVQGKSIIQASRVSKCRQKLKKIEEASK